MDTQPGTGRILVVGAGATGGFFGMRLAQHGRDVTFLVRPHRAKVLRERGLQVSGLGREEVITPQLVTATDLAASTDLASTDLASTDLAASAGPAGYDVILLSVKATALAAAMDDLGPAVGPGTAIVPFLNGLDHLRVLTGRFGPQAVLGGVVKVATELADDGTILLLGPMSTMTVGDQAGGLTDRAQRTGKLLAGAGFDLDVSADVVSAMWHKWVFIASISALTCLAGGNVGEVVAEPGGAALGPAILDEAAAIAAAAGHPLPAADYDGTRALLTAPGSATTSSLYRDLRAGHGTEVEHVFGDLTARARSLGVATPLLDLTTLVLRVHQHRVAGSAS